MEEPTTSKKRITIVCAAEDVAFQLPPPSDSGERAGPPRFEMTAYTGVPMRLSNWSYPVVVDLATLIIPSQQMPVQYAHGTRSGVGHTDRIAVEQEVGTARLRLMVEGVISRDTADAREVKVSSKQGFPWHASIGAEDRQVRFVQTEQPVEVNGRRLEGPLYVVKAEISEFSFVELGADLDAVAKVAASRKRGLNLVNKEEFEKQFKALRATMQAAIAATKGGVASGEAAKELEDGLTALQALLTTAEEAGLDVESERKLEGGFKEHVASIQAAVKAEKIKQAAAKSDAEAAIETGRQLLAAEKDRVAAIQKLCDGKNADIEAEALREGWDTERADLRLQLQALRDSRPNPPVIHTGGDSEGSQVLEAACAMSGRLNKIESHYDEPTLEAASKHFRNGIGLQELLVEAARANGWTGRSFKQEKRAVMEHAFGRPTIAGAFSAVDIAGILANVGNKFLLEGFNAVEGTWRAISSTRTVNDLKQVKSYRVTGANQFELVGAAGDIQHGAIGELEYLNKADTYAKMLVVTEEDIINDDLGAITRVPGVLGRGGGLKLNDVFWTAFMDNAAFFTAARLNYFEGATTALGINSLTTAEQMFMDQVDADGKPMGTMPKILLVPTSLGASAAVLMSSAELRDTTASTKYPVGNPHAGKFTTAVSAYLNNSSYTGHSSTAWYLLADPRDLPVIEVAFLYGQEAPRIETADADFNVLGIQMRGVLRFGVALQEYRGGVMSKGAA